MNSIIHLKRSNVSGKIPSPADLQLGELAINIRDGIVYFKSTDGTIKGIGNVPLKTIDSKNVRVESNIEIATKEDVDSKSNAIHTHIIDTLLPIPNKNAVHADVNTQIVNTTEITNDLTNRLEQLDVEGNGQLKLNVDSTGEFLESLIDGTTVANVSGALSIEGILDATVTAHEVNMLSGIAGNIQTQLNEITPLFRYRTSVATYSDLLNYPTELLVAADLIFVISDETHNGTATMYTYDGTNWMFSGAFVGAQQRDFTTDPLSLSTEVVGTLEAANVGLQLAVDTPITDEVGNFTSDNAEGALIELLAKITSATDRLITDIPLPINRGSSIVDISESLQEINSNAKGALIEKRVSVGFTANLSEVADKVRSIKTKRLGGTTKREVVIEQDDTNVEIVFDHVEHASQLCVSLVRKTANTDSTIIDKKFSDGVGYQMDKTKLHFVFGTLRPIIKSTNIYIHNIVDDQHVASIGEVPSAIIF